MPFLTKGKTNWKYVLFVLILVAMDVGGILSYLKCFNKEISSLSKFPEIKKPERKVEKQEKVFEEDIAKNYCQENCQEKGLELRVSFSPFFLNFDKDKDLEIACLCEGSSGEGLKIVLYILDKKNNEYKPVFEEKRVIVAQHEVYFEGLKAEDVDKDGIDEIIFSEDIWGALGGWSKMFLYSPLYKEWFWKKVSSERLESGERKLSTEFSPNLELEKYRAFKEFLQQQNFESII
jgi:hypothetical protein